ncbi:hypothetical protein QFC19_000441 [Naganishia cerealis]|uniref:Uncharacterized protein n=1 Tax=Naganishia cerealis TaxID=610337 RepID=A0ACC2WPY0_9TREE|nr:hypothetical protein QFC19_000441 [Naganishia cerealis]
MAGTTKSAAGLLPYDALKPVAFPADDQKILEFWRSIDAFQTGQKLSKARFQKGEGNGEFRFYDGPPFATGLPHYGHLLLGTIKDMVTRYAYSTGHHVERRFGWDTHGLPVEHQIDKNLGITSRDDVLKMGIDKYNAECRKIVLKYASEWQHIVEKMGRWIDFDNGYKTMDPSFMESVWWVFGQLWKKGMVYRGLRVMPYSTGCTTPLSNFEAGDDYRDVFDPAVTVAFELVDDPETSLLAWTTTPWTLPSNLALCVNPEFTYVKIQDLTRDRCFILLEELIGTLFPELSHKKQDPKKPKYKVVGKFKGEDMKGWRYTPLFDYFTEQFEDKAYRVVCDPYVDASSGTGIVHQAPAFGEDDHRIAIEHGIVAKDEMPPCPLDDAGRFIDPVTDFKGQHVKDADKHIIAMLKDQKKIVVAGSIKHSYPFCWRSGTPLIYRAIPVWFVKVEEIRDRLVANNSETRWVPEYVKEGRFGGWLRNARDWNISRNRYWGTPIPLWASDDMEEVVCVSSVEELKRLSGRDDITDLHRENIDPIEIPSQQGKGTLKRIEEVFDCWFESGSMPYGQQHFPFDCSEEQFHQAFPADFVSEGIDQTRGWFYTLLVLGTHLFDTAPWKNLIVSGLVLGRDGKKMSKSLKNYPDPEDIINQYGCDALRLYLVNSPVVRGDNLTFRDDGVREVRNTVIGKWINSFRFFLAQAELYERTHGKNFMYDHDAKKSENVMDRWILARCQSLIKHVKQEMEAYRLYTVVPRLLSLIDELTNWYIRFNRTRLKGENGHDDTVAALNTLFETLYTLSLTLSSFTPFTAENLYHGLLPFTPPPKNPEEDVRSVHFVMYPEVREEYFDPVVERQVKRMQSIIELTRIIRERSRIPIKQPLQELIIFHHDPEYLADVKALETYIQDEMNVFELTLTSEEEKMGIKYRATAEWPVLGKKLRKDLARVKKALPDLASEDVKKYAETGEISVDGVPLVAGDLIVTRYVDSEDNEWKSNTDDDAVILLDTRLHPELQEHFVRRELTTRCQRLRKVAGLQPTDQVDIFYSFTSGMEDALKEVVKGYEQAFSKKVGATPQPLPTDLSAKILGQYPPKSEASANGEIEAEQETSDNGYVLYAVSRLV